MGRGVRGCGASPPIPLRSTRTSPTPPPITPPPHHPNSCRYKLASEQLSKQFHYDFGLRALKSVLVMAGSLKREFADMTEDLVLMRSLRDSNLPKFVYEDVPLFKGLIEDLFPGLDCPRVAYPVLKTALEEELGKQLMHHDDEDIVQLQVREWAGMID